MKYNKVQFSRSIIISLMWLFFNWLGSIAMYLDWLNQWTNKQLTVLSFFLFISILIIILRNIDEIYFTTVIFVYFALTQYGMCFVYYLLNSNVIYEFGFGVSTSLFLFSDYYPQILALANVSMIMLYIGAFVGHKQGEKRIKNIPNNHKKNLENNICQIIGIILLIIVMIIFLYYLRSKRIRIGMSYAEYHSAVTLSTLYEWILVLYMIGICFVCATARGKVLKIGLGLFGVTAFILLGTGNRGEVMYPFLACLGVYIYRKQVTKIPLKIILLGAGIVFFLIPFVKLYRHTNGGGISNISNNAGIFNGIAEMGVSMRMTDYVISELNSGMRSYLSGFSYYNPIINILDHFVPFSIRIIPPVSYNFTNEFYKWKSMTSVAESYANFGFWGTNIHHFCIGYVISYFEGKKLESTELALLTSVVAIFIYSMRNILASVAAQIFVCFLFYFTVKFIRYAIIKKSQLF